MQRTPWNRKFKELCDGWGYFQDDPYFTLPGEQEEETREELDSSGLHIPDNVPLSVATMGLCPSDGTGFYIDVDFIIDRLMSNIMRYDNGGDSPYTLEERSTYHLFACINPGCLHFGWEDRNWEMELGGGQPAIRCNSCGSNSYVSVIALALTPDTYKRQSWFVPSKPKYMYYMWKLLLQWQKEFGDRFTLLMSGDMPMMGFRSDMLVPQAGHYISARANLRTISDALSGTAFGDYEEHGASWKVVSVRHFTQYLSPDFGTERMYEAVTAIHSMLTDPGKIIDEHAADMMRADYANEQWIEHGSEEFASWLEANAGANSTVHLDECEEARATLYGMLCSRTEVRPIIKRTGKMDWRFDEVAGALGRITLPMIWDTYSPVTYDRVFQPAVAGGGE
jgi:hypothetical protein